ncbi:MAG: putative toxin-antitoxin system toxin component, PIN family [Candidatus Electrothrix sp. AUS1_2]|nr:putative toxin-antitoxin system toxin component, PIN family [Candidatus Electrothrix sp. AUS1_2]
MRIVIDTNVLVSALKSNKGASYALISQLPSAQFQPVLSVPLYSEYQDVLTRPEHLPATISREDVIGFLRYICKISHRQKIFFLWRPWLKDPKDDMVLELAAASQSRYIITYNLRDFKGVERFGIEALPPASFLEKIRSAG